MPAVADITQTDTKQEIDIETEHLNQEDKHNLIVLCKAFKKLFHHEDNQLTFSNVVKHSIPTVDNVPIFTKSYRYPFVHKQEVRQTNIRNASAKYY